MKIVILVNTLNNVNAFIYANHINFFVKTTKLYPELEYEFFTPYRMSIDTARNNAAKIALETQADYLMFIDDDVLIPNNTLDLLLKADKDIVAGLVVIRGMPFNNMAFKFDDPNHLVYYNDLPLVRPCNGEEKHIMYDIKCDDCHLTPLEELVKVDAVGFSCCLIKTDVLKVLEPPYFITGVNHTEDIYFCMKTKELTPEPEIFLHTGIECGHLLNAEPIEWRTRRKMQEFYGKVAKKQDHGLEYINRCLASIK